MEYVVGIVLGLGVCGLGRLSGSIVTDPSIRS